MQIDISVLKQTIINFECRADKLLKVRQENKTDRSKHAVRK